MAAKKHNKASDERERAMRAKIASERRELATEAASDVLTELARVPTTAEDYRRRMSDALSLTANLVRPFLAGEVIAERDHTLRRAWGWYTGGFRLDQEALERFDDAMAEARDAIANAFPVLNRNERDAEILSIRGPAAQRDEQFQHFMRRTTGGGAS
jgi:hypothetical protein